MYTYTKKYWTSDLIISMNKDVDKFKSDIDEVILQAEKLSTKFHKGDRDSRSLCNLSVLERYSYNGDNTCMMKGVVLDNLATLFECYDIDDYVISFGGDICAKTKNTLRIPIYGTKFSIEVTGNVTIFTSGNTDKRGNHIIGCEEGKQVTLVVGWKDGFQYNTRNQMIDAFATKLAANDNDAVNELKDWLFYHTNWKSYVPLILQDGKVKNYTYCASPFFNDKQIEVRDKMVSQFINVFRPDQREIAKQYNSDQGNRAELASNVVLDNEIGISDCDLLLFPNSTDDLGTLYEVGKAIGLYKPIIKYNENSDSYTLIPEVTTYQLDSSKYYLFNCNLKFDVIKLGYVSTRINNENDRIYYMLHGSPDNIMLSVNYNHVENGKNSFVLYKKKLVESDTNDTEIIGEVDDLTASQMNTTNRVIEFDQLYDIDLEVNDKVVTSVS